MFSIIVSAHGTLSNALIDSGEMIFGQLSDVYTVNFDRGENTDHLVDKLTQTMQENHLQDSKVLILVDLYGGSPFNAAARLAMENENIEVVSGVNLPLLLEIVSNRSSKELDDMMDLIKEIAPQTIKSFRESLVIAEEDDLE